MLFANKSTITASVSCHTSRLAKGVPTLLVEKNDSSSDEQAAALDEEVAKAIEMKKKKVPIAVWLLYCVSIVFWTVLPKSRRHCRRPMALLLINSEPLGAQEYVTTLQEHMSQKRCMEKIMRASVKRPE